MTMEKEGQQDSQKDKYLTQTLTRAVTKSDKVEKSEELSIFHFDDYAEFLSSYVNIYGKYTHGPYNLTNWSKRLGYKSPSSLTMVLNKQRIPPVRMIHRLAKDFKLTENETKYFELLVEIEKLKQKGKDFSSQLREAHALYAKKKYQKIDLDEFSIISDWYCYVVKRLLSCKTYIQDLDWMHKKLRKKVSKPQIKDALDRLESVGLIKKENERYVDSRMKIHTGNQVAAAAIRNHHRGMIGQALDALEEQGVDNRIFQGLTMNMDKESDLKDAFNEITEFINNFNAKYSNENQGDSVYQLNIQFFEHSKEIQQ